MASSLATQLAKSASLNSALLADRSRRKSSESYLFTGKQADQYDLSSLLGLAQNGLLQLSALDPKFRAFEESLFSEASRNVDRTMMSKDANKQLNRTVGRFLSLLGPFVMEAPTGKVLEWLVRRYRINEFNVEQILSLFLPYHEAPHFAKMLSILHINPNSQWSFLLPYKSAAQSVPRVALVAEMLKNDELARFTMSLLPEAIKSGTSHHTLHAFNAACLHDFILQSTNLGDGIVAALLSALLEPLRKTDQALPKDALLGSYILLSALSQKCGLTGAAVKTIVTSMISSAHLVSTKQFLTATVSVCEPQEECDNLSDEVALTVANLSDIETHVSEAAGWVGIEKVIRPLLVGLVSCIHDPSSRSLLARIMSLHGMLLDVDNHLSKVLLQTILENDEVKSSAAQKLLSDLHQRTPEAVRLGAEELGDEGEDLKNRVEQIVLSLSLTLPKVNGSVKKTDYVLASMDMDALVRAKATEALLLSLTRRDALSEDERISIQSAILSRIQDADVQVLQKLYGHPKELLGVVVQAPKEYISSLVSAVNQLGSKPKRAVLRLHLNFFGSHAFACLPDDGSKGQAVFDIIFPFLLFSKPRQHTAECVWEVIRECALLGNFELLSGCLEDAQAMKGEESDDSIARMADMNARLTVKMADNFISSNRYSDLLEALLKCLSSENPHVRNPSLLVLRALLVRLSGEHQVEAALAVLDALSVKVLNGTGLLKYDVQDMFEDHSFGKILVSKPTSSSTSQLLLILSLEAMTKIKPPSGVILNWLTVAPSDSPDIRGRRFVQLTRTVFRLVNMAPSDVASPLMRNVFRSLGDDGLSFLAGIWSGVDPLIEVGSGLRALALDYGRAFLMAHLGLENSVDFQVILPSILVALHSGAREEREKALKCITILKELLAQKFTSKSPIYGFDILYGETEGQIQYLTPSDLQRYLDLIVEHYDHFLHDPNYLLEVHQRSLKSVKGEKKRDLEFKHRIICYLCSHISAFVLPHAQLSLLKSVSGLHDHEKAEIFAPTIEGLFKESSRMAIDNIYGSLLDEFAGLIVASFDASAAEKLNETDGTLWDIYMFCFNCFYSTEILDQPRITMTHELMEGLWNNLRPDRKIEVGERLLEIGVNDLRAYPSCRDLLSSLLSEPPILLRLLQSLQPEASTPSAKKAKLTAPTDSRPERLSFLLEIISSKQWTGSVDVLSTLLDTLNNVLQHVSPADVDVSYIEQLLMSAIEKAEMGISGLPNTASSSVRTDVLVELIRVSDNPQTFQQALLLLAKLVRLAPDSVLHNIMPIFTFMGSNVFHRDDTYSFRVVQQTIDSIIPVMVSSLKNSSADRTSLYLGARDLLRVFADASNHVPRHRRASLFIHLVDVLGPNDFLSPVCMLLVEKVASRVTHQSKEETKSTLSLPLSIINHYKASFQVYAVTDMLREAERLIRKTVDGSDTSVHFLDWPSEEERSPQIVNVYRRRSLGLIVFAGLAIEEAKTSRLSTDSEGGSISDLVSVLVSLSTTKDANLVKLDECVAAGRISLDQCLRSMPSRNFIDSVWAMLDSDNYNVQQGALQLVNERLPKVADSVRQTSTATLVKIIDATMRSVKAHADSQLADAGFNAIRTVCVTSVSGESAALLNCIPVLVTFIRERHNIASALAALVPFPEKLGPRLIPYFKEVVSVCLAALRDVSLHDGHASAISVLLALLKSIPTFWGTNELLEVSKLCVEGADSKEMPSLSCLSKAIAKHGPSKLVVPTLVDAWQTTLGRPSRIAAYFELFKRTVRNAQRSIISENVRPIFSVILKGLDSVKDVSEAQPEQAVISAFVEVVVKLNDTSFRPLFRRLYDWGFADDATDEKRKITFCHVYLGLLDYFNALMNPYMSFLQQPFTTALEEYSTKPPSSYSLWTGILGVLKTSMEYDDGAYWRDDRLRAVSTPLIAQVPHCASSRSKENHSLLQHAIVALIDNATDDSLLKQSNLALLMHTRSEDPKARLLALTISEALWSEQGSKMLGLVQDTTSFLIECAEDENDDVVEATMALKEVIEGIAGKLDLQ